MSDNTGSNSNSTRRISKASLDNPIQLALRTKNHSKSVGWKKQNIESNISGSSDKSLPKIINHLGEVTPRPLSFLKKYKEEATISENFNEKYSPNIDPKQTKNTLVPFLDTRTIEAPFSRTVFGFGAKQSDSIFTSTDNEQDNTFLDDIYSDFLDNAINSNKKVNVEEMVEIEISETDTITIFETPSVSVFADSPEADKIRQQHEISKEIGEEKATGKFKSSSNLTLTKDNSDRYTEHSINTFNNDLKNKATQTTNIMNSEFSCNVNTWDLFHYSTQEDIENTEIEVNIENLNPNVEGENIIEKKSEDTILLDEKLLKNNLNNLTKNNNFKKMLQSMERSINLNIYKDKLSIYRGFNTVSDVEKASSPKKKKVPTATRR